MVSKPTGRPRGRPRKSVVSLAAGPVGRPFKPLARDPNRWALAFVERAIRAGAAAGYSELRIIDTFVTGQFGRIVETPENLERLRRDQLLYVWMRGSRLPPWRMKQSPSDRCETWRYKNAFRPFIDDLRRKLRRHRGRNDDANRLRTMADILEICLIGKRIDKARRLAASIGEAEYFEEKLRPSCFPYADRPLGRPIFP